MSLAERCIGTAVVTRIGDATGVVVGVEDSTPDGDGPNDFVVLAVRDRHYQGPEIWAIRNTLILVDEARLQRLDDLGLLDQSRRAMHLKGDE